MTSSGEQRRPTPAEDHAFARQNVYLTIVINIFLVLGSTIAFGPIFDKYILQLSHKNAVVGLVESVSGVTALLVFLPVAFLVDSRPHARASLVAQCSSLLLLGGLLFVVAVSLDSFWALIPSLVLNGVFYELFSSASEALFADSAGRLGGRANLYVQKQAATLLAAAGGPLLTLVFTWAEQDRRGGGGDEEDHTRTSAGRAAQGGGGRPGEVAGRGPPLGGGFLPFGGVPFFRPGLVDGTGVFGGTSGVGGGVEVGRRLGAARASSAVEVLPWHSRDHFFSGFSITTGTSWSLSFMHLVLLLGTLVFVPILWWLPKYRDLTSPNDVDRGGRLVNHDVELLLRERGRRPPVELQEPAQPTGAPTTNGVEAPAGDAAPVDSRRSSHPAETRSPNDPLRPLSNQERERLFLESLTPGQKWVPIIVGISDFITSVGAGMTVKFFNLFFIQDYGRSRGPGQQKPKQVGFPIPKNVTSPGRGTVVSSSHPTGLQEIATGHGHILLRMLYTTLKTVVKNVFDT